MDVNGYWQENKRFVVFVASGVIVFVIGSMLVNSFFRNELVAQKRSADSATKKLKTEPMYRDSDLAAAQKENEALKVAVATLASAVAFDARPQFRFDPAKGSASNQYFATVSSVREELLTLAGRSNLRLPEDLGLPALSPTREADIVRYLEALDLVDRAARIAMATGVERIDALEIKLDPKLTSRQGAGDIERTTVEFKISGRPSPMVQFLTLSQSANLTKELAADAKAAAPATVFSKAALGPLLIDKMEMVPSRTKPNEEAVLEVTFVVARLHGA